LTACLRARIRETIELVLDEELEAALGAARSERTGSRAGYRNGAISRSLLTEHGPQHLTIPRGRLFTEDGSTTEWRSALVDRYARRTKKVDEAIVGVYFSGGNTRRIRKGLSPLLGEKHLSKSSVSRLVQRLKTHFEAWRNRDLSDLTIAYVYLDAMNLPVRLARRVVKVPVLAAIGVRDDGEKILLSLEIARTESTVAWKGVVEDLARRDLRAPALAIVDGNPGLLRALRSTWPETEIQRCANHKRENLFSKAPKHSHAELKRDYDAIVYADDLQAAQTARRAFLRKWKTLSTEAVRSLEEAGDDLLTFYRFPKSQWKGLRTTNPIEGVNSAFRRRTKTQAAFTNEDSALVLLYGLFAMEQITLRRIDGWKDLKEVKMPGLQHAA
jgi:transposase-like protein